MSQLKVDTITDEAGTGSPDFPNGVSGDGSGLSGVVKTSGDQSISGTLTATGFVGNGSGLTNLPSSAPTTAQVLSATAGASVGEVGSYAQLGTPAGALNITEGSTRAGSNLRFANMDASVSARDPAQLRLRNTPAGTWRLMGNGEVTFSTYGAMSLWLRIS
jgi:hypothetical protein